jgi:hypothetical protein
MKLWISCLALALGLSAAACGPRHPAYRDINTNQSAPAVNQAPDSSTLAPPANNNASPAIPAGPAAAQPAAIKMPAFMDAAKGSPKDLPNYPGAAIVNIQYGPQQDTEIFSVAMQTGDPMDKIAAFYDKIVKSNGWDVTQRQVDPEYAEWTMKKNTSDEAKVVVQKPKQGPRQGNMYMIVAARTAKSAQPQPAKP